MSRIITANHISLAATVTAPSGVEIATYEA